MHGQEKIEVKSGVRAAQKYTHKRVANGRCDNLPYGTRVAKVSAPCY